MTRKMKDSGIEWIGEMNSNWETVPFKFILKERKQRNMPIITEERLSLSIGIGVTLYSEKTTNLDRYKDDVTQYKVVYPNDLVINSMNVIVGAEGISNYLGCVSPAYYVMYSDNMQRFITKYYDYCLKTSTIQKVLFCLGKGIMAIDRGEGRVNTCRLKVSSYDLGRLEFPTPAIDEQQRIVDYLDNKCIKIYQTMEKQKQVIEKLKEYKQSIISEAVTKGLNSDVKKKDSGIEWIGEIPEHWICYRLKGLLQEAMQYGANESGEIFDENEPRYVRITDIISECKLKDEDKLSLSIEKAKSFILEDGDVLFARSGATVGKTFLYKREFGLCAFAGYLIKAKLNDQMIPQYLLYYTMSKAYEEWKNRIFIQATIQNIGANKYSTMEIPRPTIDEQTEIINYLDKKCDVIDKAILNKEKLIEKLTEYKKSLIYECVTGKREV